MIGIAERFAREHKSAATYLDQATNYHDDEKGSLVHRALERVAANRPHVVEIGPGGGAAVEFLAAQLTERPRPVQLTLVEAPGVMSESLAMAVDRFNTIGSCELVRGWAHDIADLLAEQVDVVSASAVLHEIYSYSGAYTGLHAMLRTLPTVIREYGYFVYRDVYAVAAASLHERVVHSYGTRAWLQFLRMFLPHYLAEGIHPYHHHDDEVVARQDSRIVPVSELDTRVCATIEAPVGIFREVQLHYLTFRDHVWRSGTAGFRPVLDGPLAGDWIDFRSGHKRVHYAVTGSQWMPTAQQANLLAVSEPFGDHHVMDGDLFDAVSDVALMAFMAAAERGDEDCARIWQAWLAREGRETYAYLTTGDLVTTVAVQSIEATAEQGTVLMPVRADDVFTRDRLYYNRFLTKRLSNPLVDAKQLCLFQNIPVRDTDTIAQALGTLRTICTKPDLARLQTAVQWRG